PVQEHHEVGQDRVGVDAPRADLAHQIHAHRIAAEGEERAVAERQDAAIAPDEIERDGEDGVADVFAEQLHQIGRDVEGGIGRRRQRQDGHEDRRQREESHENEAETVQSLAHASTARPLSANSPRGRFWMNRMMTIRSTIWPCTAPITGSRILLAIPSVSAPSAVPHRFPTPPNTTTMKLSMMWPWPRLGDTLSICD